MSYVTVETNPVLRAAIAGIGEAQLHEIGPKAEAKAKDLVPVRTGELRDSIHWFIEGNQLVLGADAPYAAYVELGTSKMQAEPFLAPALSGLL